MEQIPRAHEIYRHFKGNIYQIVTIAEHSETGEKLVIYQVLYGDFKTYARPLSMFTEKVDKEKYPDAVQEYRFEPVDREKNEGGSQVPVKTDDHIDEHNEHNETARIKEDMPYTPQEEASQEELDIDPMVLEFLDADTYETRLNILAGLHHRITDDMINVMAMATDIEVKPGEVEERYVELRNCLLKLEKFECNRLR